MAPAVLVSGDICRCSTQKITTHWIVSQSAISHALAAASPPPGTISRKRTPRRGPRGSDGEWRNAKNDELAGIDAPPELYSTVVDLDLWGKGILNETFSMTRISH